MSKIASLRFWKFSGSIMGLAALFVILIAANFMLSTIRLRHDLTEEKLYTLSDGTRQVLQKLTLPITLKFYCTRASAEVPVPLKQFAQQVEDLLQEYRIAAQGKIILETYDPEPDSDAEEWAERYGLLGQNLGLMGGPRLYLGLVAVQGDHNQAIPFIDPRTTELLEYNISRLISRVSNPRKPVVGVMSSLPVMGVKNFPYAMPGQPQPKNQPPWVAFQDLGEDYDVRQVAPDADKIDADLDVLIVVHPKGLSEKTQYALDQFVLRGGRLLAFVDPLCLVDANSRQDNPMMPMAPLSSDLGKLTAAWGLTYEPDKIVADMDAATRVRQGDNSPDDSPVFLNLREGNLNGKDVLTARLESIIMPCAGAFSGAGSGALGVEALIVSSPQSQLIDPMTARMGSEAVRRDFKPGLQRLNLAVRLQGKFKTAFPEGQPKDKPDDKTGQAKPPETEPAPTDEPGLTESIKSTTVILVGDVDMLFDQFAVQELSMFGYRAFQPMNDNLVFFANAVEQLSGSAELASVRSRGRFDRPFDRVLVLQRQAQERWLLQERALQEKLEQTRERLEALQSKKDKSQKFILSAEQEQEIQRFKQEQLKTQRELKQVRKNLREGIERLGVTVKLINILLIPALVCLAGLLFAWYRRTQNK